MSSSKNGAFWTIATVVTPFLWYAWVAGGSRQPGRLVISAPVACAPGAAAVGSVGGAPTSAALPASPDLPYWERGARNAVTEGGPEDVLPAAQKEDPYAALWGRCWTLRAVGEVDVKYEVCVGDRIRQILLPTLETVVTGNFAGWAAPGDTAAAGTARLASASAAPDWGSQLYLEGTVCEGYGARASRLVFTCARDAAADAPTLLSVTEPAICRYQVELGTPLACS